jgi:ERCC4-related helicase
VVAGVSHPKFARLLTTVNDHFREMEGESTRIIIFTSFRCVSALYSVWILTKSLLWG